MKHHSYFAYNPEMYTPAWSYGFVSQYLTFYKRVMEFFRANPEGRVKLSWNGDEMSQEQFRADFRRALDRRISFKDPARAAQLTQWRNMTLDAQAAMHRDQGRIQAHFTRRVIVRSLETKQARQRYENLIYGPDDY